MSSSREHCASSNSYDYDPRTLGPNDRKDILVVSDWYLCFVSFHYAVARIARRARVPYCARMFAITVLQTDIRDYERVFVLLLLL